jgi:hypothetical protein
MTCQELSEVLKKLGCIPSEDKLEYLSTILAQENFKGYKQGWNDLEMELNLPDKDEIIW